MDSSFEAKREALADYAHEAWSRWMEHLCSCGQENDDGSLSLSVEFVDRWRRQMATPYSRLSEQEKQSDRAEADRVIALIKNENQ